MNVEPVAEMIAPSYKSPFAVVVAVPLLGDELFPMAEIVVSSELYKAIPEYSKMMSSRFAEAVSDTVTTLGPAAMFSA